MMKPDILPYNDGRTVTFGPCRLSYVHLFEKYVGEGEDEKRAKYSTGILIPKNQAQTIDAIKKCIAAAYNQAVTKYWNGKTPAIQESGDNYPLRDGDNKGSVEYDGCYYINAKTGRRPIVIDRSDEDIRDEDEMYSGVWAWVCVTFYGYKVNGKCGIAAALELVKKCKDDEQFGNSVNRSTALRNAVIDEDEDDL